MKKLRKKRVLSFLALSLVITSTVFFTGCKKDEETGSTTFKFTDAPTDNSNIKGVFVTVTEIKIDGKTYDAFKGKQTIDLMAYQNGKTKLYGTGDLEAKQYSNISLVLEHDKDAMGNSPGCYVLTKDDVKHTLSATSSSTSEIVINKQMDITSSSQSNFIIDLNIRKLVKSGNSTNSSSDYSFVTDAELNNSARIVNESKSGFIKGNCTDNYNGDKVIVYAYKKGTFDSNTETNGTGASNVTFANAVTSATVDGQGNYQLSFLEEGEYELHFASYEEEANGSFSFEGMLEVTALSSGTLLNSLYVSANATVTMNVAINGLL